MIANFEILNPIIDKNKPFMDNIGRLVVPIDIIYRCRYKFYLLCARNDNFGNREYFILLSQIPFDPNNRPASIDGYGRLKLRLSGEFANFVHNELQSRKNLEMIYEESVNDIDIYRFE